ncbi:MAG: hypothetical protein FVQ79_01580 [Planctomycetes bacterium]|nr:hypothetical protein [Planctomycetota bacterium]
MFRDKEISFFFSVVIIFCFSFTCSAEGLDTSIISPNLYVAPDGDDSNPGTEAKPFATLERAQNAVREFKQKVPKPITVFVREGTYYLSRPLVFTAADSGTDLQPITYAAYPGEKPTISGGVKLEAKWESYRDGIMKCSVPSGMDFNQFFINGKRQMRARYPNYDPDVPLMGEGGYLNTTGVAGRGFTYDPETFTTKRWANPSDAIVHIFPGSYWNNFQFRVKSVDWDSHTVKLGEGGWQTALLRTSSRDFFGTKLRKGSHFFVDNVFEELDAPGEWYLDKEKNILYYMPGVDLDLSCALVEGGLLKRLIEVKGSRQEPVRHLYFKDFRFTHTSATFIDEYITPSTGDWGIHRGGSIFMTGAEDCAVENCFFDSVGGNAIYIDHHARRIRIYGNTFTYTGDSAVCLVGKHHVIEDGNMPCPFCDAKSHWSFGPEPEDYPAYCLISNNVMHHIGVYGKQTAGVFMAITMKNTISHNHIHHMPRAAICTNDPFWGGHIIEYNYVHDTVQETNDHGTFNSWGRGHYWCVKHYKGRVYHDPGDVKQDAKFTTIYRYNYIRENVTDALCMGKDSTNYGIDMDDGSANFHLYNNVVIGVGVQNRDGSHRIIENNIFVNPNRGISYHVSYTNSGDKFARNIVVQNSDWTFFYILLQTDKGKWIDEIDYNVFSGTAEFSRSAKNFKEWQNLGFDEHSVLADPMFVDPANGDYHVKAGSPALKLGFKNFDISDAGLLPDFPKKWEK